MNAENRDQVFEKNIAAIWQEQRVSCPHRDILHAFVEGGLPEAAADYVRFHLEVVCCPWCTVALQEMEVDSGLPEIPHAEMAAVTERTMHSTIIQVRKAKQ